MIVETEDIILKIPRNSDGGLQFVWEDNAVIQTENDGKSFYIKANKAGLRSLANHFLSLAQDTVTNHNHFHLDDLNGFEERSCELIVEKDNNLK